MNPFHRYVISQVQAYSLQKENLTHTQVYEKVCGELLDLFEQLNAREIKAAEAISNQLWQVNFGETKPNV
jgi:hypothetical protein